MINHYTTLGVNPSAKTNQIFRSFLKRLKYSLKKGSNTNELRLIFTALLVLQQPARKYYDLCLGYMVAKKQLEKYQRYLRVVEEEGEQVAHVFSQRPAEFLEHYRKCCRSNFLIELVNPRWLEYGNFLGWGLALIVSAILVFGYVVVSEASMLLGVSVVMLFSGVLFIRIALVRLQQEAFFETIKKFKEQ